MRGRGSFVAWANILRLSRAIERELDAAQRERLIALLMEEVNAVPRSADRLDLLDDALSELQPHISRQRQLIEHLRTRGDDTTSADRRLLNAQELGELYKMMRQNLTIRIVVSNP